MAVLAGDRLAGQGRPASRFPPLPRPRDRPLAAVPRLVATTVASAWPPPGRLRSVLPSSGLASLRAALLRDGPLRDGNLRLEAWPRRSHLDKRHVSPGQQKRWLSDAVARPPVTTTDRQSV